MGVKINRLKRQMRRLFGDQLWELNVEDFSNARRRFIKFIKLTRITFFEFAENRMGFQCVALSYFAMLAMVPFAAFIFAVGDGLGYHEKLAGLLYSALPSYPDVIDIVLEKAGNIIASAQSSAVGLISALFFLWSVIWMMFQVERVFNNVWKIRKIPRKLYKRFFFYLGMLFLSPFVIMIFGTGIMLYSNFTGLIGMSIHISEISGIITFLGWVVFDAAVTMIISVMYKYIPATRVQYRNALSSAVISGLAFTIFQYMYLEAQVFMSRLNGVYGALAAIPLFLMWINYSWQIIIYGEQLCFGMQNVDTYNIPEGKLRDFTPLRDRIKEEINNLNEDN